MGRISLSIFCLLPLLALAQQPKLVFPIGHVDAIEYAEFSADGTKVLTSSNDATAKIWSSDHGMLLTDLNGHTGPVNSARFSPDGKKVVTASDDSTAGTWNSVTGEKLTRMVGHTDKLLSAEFSPDGKRILTASLDGTAKIWDAETGRLLRNLAGNSYALSAAHFSPNGKKIVTASLDNHAKIWNAESGALIADIKGHTGYLTSARFSPDGKKIVTASSDRTARIWDASTGKWLADLNGHGLLVNTAVFSPDGKKIVTASWDYTARTWDGETGRLLATLSAHTGDVKSAGFSPDGKKIVTASLDNTAKIWDSESGKLLKDIRGHRDDVMSVFFSPNGKKILTGSADMTARTWDAETGNQLANLKGRTSWITTAQYSPSGRKILTASAGQKARVWDAESGVSLITLDTQNDGAGLACFSRDEKKILTADATARVWDAATGNLLREFAGHSDMIWSTSFSPDGSLVITSSLDGTVKIWDYESGTERVDVKVNSDFVFVTGFSPDGKKIVTGTVEGTVQIWDAESGALLTKLAGHTDAVHSAAYSPDGKKLITGSGDATAKVWDAESGALLLELNRHTRAVRYACFSPDGKKIVTASIDHSVRIWDAQTGEPERTFELNALAFDIHFEQNKIVAASKSEVMLFDLETQRRLRTFIAIDSTDYLTYDVYGRYDGTEAARKMLYFTCGDEVISLDQVKDQLWIPGLAPKLMRGESLAVPKLSELQVCGVTPIIETRDHEKSFRFIITPRSGGLGETVLYINGIEFSRYEPAELAKKENAYTLEISRDKLAPYFVAGRENLVTVKAFTRNNDIAARGLSVRSSSNDPGPTVPNLYAVMVGVSDYKGETLDLKYAAKDARDLSVSVAISARKLLNRDGSEHVFIYHISTADDSNAIYPWKKNIEHVFREIALKAKPNDILLIFFAGHGVAEGDKKQFYFLTADASDNSDLSSSGISMAELNEWMNPRQIKAQKRILIFDACNSGQAINDLVTIGNRDDQYVAARNDEETRRIKTIEKLNERSGIMILSASASNQSAYELAKYAQGILTYCLLKAIREDPSILEEEKLLSVDKWFWTAEKNVRDIIRQSGHRQQPQKFGTGGFYIGEVDEEVIASIKLPKEKALFVGSVFLDAGPGDDHLEISKQLNQQLNNISARATETPISYTNTSNSPDAYSLTGTYEITGSELKVKVNVKQGRDIRHRFEVRGRANEVTGIIGEILHTVEAWLRKQ